MIRTPTIKKEDFFVRNLGRVLCGYRQAKNRIATQTVASDFSFSIYDRYDNFYGYSSPEIIMPISASDVARIAPFLVHLEDRHFYEHSGVDWRSLTRSFIVNLRHGRIMQGGSTISMQLVRNTLIESNRSLLRKVIEIALAKKMEMTFSKEEILRLYCEQVFMGKGLRGLQSASLFIYRKPLAKLDDYEIFGLLGMLRAPLHFSPYQSPAAYFCRQQFIAKILTGKIEDRYKRLNPVCVSRPTCLRLARAVWRSSKKK